MARLDNPIEVPDFDFSDRSLDYNKWYDVQIAEIETNTDPDANDLSGSVLRFHVADGYSVYVVTWHSPLTIAHVEIGDAYAIDPAHVRGLRVEDVRLQLRQAQSMRRIFSPE
jgi:hypothetical protein